MPMHRFIRHADGSLVTPFIIAIDTREQLPFAFADVKAEADQRREPVRVLTQRTTIGAGDYSLYGHEEVVAVERKSKEDLFGTVGGGRDRFERELERLSLLKTAAVVIEADWLDIFANPPPWTELRPKTVFRSIIAWQSRFKGIHWWTCPDRPMAEQVTFRILERYWRDYVLVSREGTNGA